MAGLEHRFERFTGSLYEARWHQVLGFLRQSKPLLPILARSWDEAKYLRGVEHGEAGRGAQAAAQDRADAGRGLTAFDPKVLTKALHSSLFHAYAAMALLLEEVPEQLATEAERCPCHGALTRRLSLYRAKGMFGKHYGSRATTCPMAGKNMPELVAGVLDDVFAQV